MQCSGKGSKMPMWEQLHWLKWISVCLDQDGLGCVLLHSDTDTWQVKDEEWPQAAAVTPPQCVCKETPDRTITAVSGSHSRKPCLSALRKPSKMNSVPSKNAPTAMKLLELEDAFREFFWTSNSHSHRSSKLWAEPRQAPVWRDKR